MRWRVIRDTETKIVVKKKFAFLPIYNTTSGVYIWFEPYYFKRTYYYKMVLYKSFFSDAVSDIKNEECIKDELVTKEEYVEYLKNPTKPWRRWKIERVK